MVGRKWRWGWIALAVALGGCAILQRGREPFRAERLPTLHDDLDVASLQLVIERTRPLWTKRGDAQALAAADAVLAAFSSSTDPAVRRAAIERAFAIRRLRAPLLVTGYYEPEITGRLAPDETFRHPIHGRPPDLVDVDPAQLQAEGNCRAMTGRLVDGRLTPFPTRAEIDSGMIDAANPPIAWTDNRIDLFFLHIQGSGRMRLDDGRVVGIKFSGTNGRRFRGLSSIMIEKGLVPRQGVTMDALKSRLAQLADAEQAAILAENPRYTFFKIAAPGAVGSAGVELVAGRSIATDTRLVPHGSLVYVATPSVRRVAVAHDTGAAIVGPHIDLFTGAGAEAGAQAGRMKERGVLYVLVPRT